MIQISPHFKPGWLELCKINIFQRRSIAQMKHFFNEAHSIIFLEREGLNILYKHHCEIF